MWSKLLDMIPGVGQIKLSLTAVMWLVGLLAVGAVIGFGVYEAHRVNALETQAGKDAQTITGLQNTNKDLDAQNKLLQGSGKVTDAVTTGNATQKQAATTTTNAIATNTSNAVNTIIQKYQPKGPTQVVTPAVQQQEDHEIDEAQMTGAWQTFCAAIPSDKACAQVPVKAVAPQAASGPSAQVGPIAMSN